MMEPMNDMEIRLKFQKLDDTLEGQDDALERIEKKLTEVDTKVGYTNGKIAEIIKVQERWKGARWAFSVVGVLIILPLASWVLYNQAQESRRINTAIAAYLQNNYTIVKINNGN